MDIVDERDSIFDTRVEVVHCPIDDHGRILFLIGKSECSIAAYHVELIDAYTVFPALKRFELIELKIEF